MTPESRPVTDYCVHIFWSEEDGGYIADIPDLACCSAFGDTPEEALRQVAMAKEAWLDAARAKRGGRRRRSPTCPLDDRCQSDNNAGAWKSVRQS
jgi:predicted RNase H-like HicB family nuclease